MCRLGDSCLAVVGGRKENEKYRDILAYNVKKNTWSPVDPMNGPLPLIEDLRICYDLQSLYFIGVLGENQPSILELKFNEFELIKSEICASCVKRLDNKEK